MSVSLSLIKEADEFLRTHGFNPRGVHLPLGKASKSVKAFGWNQNEKAKRKTPYHR